MTKNIRAGYSISWGVGAAGGCCLCRVKTKQAEGFGQWVLRSVWHSGCVAHSGGSKRGISDEVLDWYMIIQSWLWLCWNSAGHYLCVLTSSGFISVGLLERVRESRVVRHVGLVLSQVAELRQEAVLGVVLAVPWNQHWRKDWKGRKREKPQR